MYAIMLFANRYDCMAEDTAAMEWPEIYGWRQVLFKCWNDEYLQCFLVEEDFPAELASVSCLMLWLARIVLPPAVRQLL